MTRYSIGDYPLTLHALEDRACVIDLSAFAMWRERKTEGEGNPISVQVKDFNERRALKLAQKKPALCRSAERQSAEDRAAELQTRVRVRLWERFEIRIDDPAAATWVDLSEGSPGESFE